MYISYMGHKARNPIFNNIKEKRKIHNTMLFNQVHITSGAVATLRNVGESADRLDHCYRGRYWPEIKLSMRENNHIWTIRMNDSYRE